jgi:hypothetical protein
MLRRLGHSAYTLLLPLLTASCSGWLIHHYEGKPTSIGPHFVAERGRSIRLIEAGIVYQTGNPFSDSWTEFLVEPCESQTQATSEPAEPALPCWPTQTWRVSQAQLSAIYNGLPDYRAPRALRSLAEQLNREVGTFRRAFIVGTSPLAIAFWNESPDLAMFANLKKPTTWPTSAPGVIVVQSGSGETITLDRRRRYVQFVSQIDLRDRANVVLVFPEELDVRTASSLLGVTGESEWRAHVFVLPEPAFIEEVIHLVTIPDQLRRRAQLVVEIPVRGR